MFASNEPVESSVTLWGVGRVSTGKLLINVDASAHALNMVPISIYQSVNQSLSLFYFPEDSNIH